MLPMSKQVPLTLMYPNEYQLLYRFIWSRGSKPWHFARLCARQSAIGAARLELHGRSDRVAAGETEEGPEVAVEESSLRLKRHGEILAGHLPASPWELAGMAVSAPSS